MEQDSSSDKPTNTATNAPLKRRSPQERIKAWLHEKPPKKRLLIVTSAAIAFLLVGAGALAFFGPEAPAPNPEPVVESTYVPPPEMIPSPLTGVEVAPEISKRPVTAVMIENSIDARPQSGLYDAGIVYEAIAEGGITRFMALFQEARPGNVGPIRSARPYYVRWAAGYDASYLHSGGSGEALSLIQQLGVKDLDHGKLGDSIASRVSNRFAPHNVYTNFDRIDAKNNELGYTSSEFTGFTRKADDVPTAELPATATSINVNISSANYNTHYDYDVDTNSYKRVMAGVAHTDQENGKQINPKVLVMLVMSYGINPNGIHSQYGNVGSGEALVFQDGRVQTVQWRKSSDKASLELVDAAGKAVELNAGQTWITPIQAGRVSYTP